MNAKFKLKIAKFIRLRAKALAVINEMEADYPLLASAQDPKNYWELRSWLTSDVGLSQEDIEKIVESIENNHRAV